MKVNVQSVNFKLKNSLQSFVNHKINRLTSYSKKILDLEVYLKLDNNHKKENKIVELKLHLPKEIIVVKKEGSSFEAAMTEASMVIKRALRKRKKSRIVRLPVVG